MKGIHAKRLNEHNPREVAFDSQWEAENKRQDILGCLMERRT